MVIAIKHMERTELIEKAQKRVEEKKSFYKHLNAFCIVTFIFFLLNFVTFAGTWFFVLPLSGWALALIGHYLRVFGFPSFKSEDWEENQLQIEVDKLQRQQNLGLYHDDYSDNTLELRELEKAPEEYDNDELV